MRTAPTVRSVDDVQLWSGHQRRATMLRRLGITLGLAVVALALWLGLVANVDVDADTSPTNCGPNAVRVLREGPSVNRAVLDAGDCRTSAALNLGLCGALVAMGVGLALGGIGPGGRSVPPRLAVFTSIPLVGLNTAALTVLWGSAAMVLAEVHDALAYGAVLLVVVPVCRGARLGVTMDADVVVVRNVLRTHHLLTAHVSEFAMADTPWWIVNPPEWVAIRLVDGREIGVTVLCLPAFGFLQGPARRRLAAMNATLASVRPRLG